MVKSKPVRSRRVSHHVMRKHMAEIAQHHFSAAFNDMFAYVAAVNPRGHSYVRQYLRAMSEQLYARGWDHE